MNPIAIFRHYPTEGPGYLADFLDTHAVPWRLICIDAGEAVPVEAAKFSGLVFMGGPMSVNDPLPWIAPVLSLIQDAVRQDIPVLGHCLGGQLMSKALGGLVSRNPVKEIGWGTVMVANSVEARSWFGEGASTTAFHWHGETFTVPAEAEHLLSSAHCVNQAWALGKHLALQCHVEMTEEMIHTWCDVGAAEIAESINSPGVQAAAEILEAMAFQLPELRRLAEQIYRRWLAGANLGKQ